MKSALFILSFTLLLSNHSLAGNSHDDEHHHHHEAHVHGEAHLQMVMESSSLELELRAPAKDVVGFEHAPQTEAERQQVTDAIARLENGNNLFRFEGAGCAQQKAQASQQIQKGGHAEFHGHYRFRCEPPAGLSHIDVQISDIFSGISRIHAEWIFNSRQGARTLGNDSRRIEVK